MTRSSLLPFALAAVLGASWSCGDTQDVAPTILNFNRPTDIAFACYGGVRQTDGNGSDASQPIATSAEPRQACDIYSTTATPITSPPGQEQLGNTAVPTNWYAFVLQSVPGTVGIATWTPKPVLTTAGDVTVIDADPLTPGKSGITMGEDPVALVTDKVGCYELTANGGSCDLSALDITSALDYQADPKSALGSGHPVKVDRIALTNANGIPMRAKPAAMVAEPPGGTIGVWCSENPQPTGLVYVAYPACHLVAGIDTSTGTVVTGIQYDASGVASVVDGTVTCPDECSGGGQTTPGPRPTSLDLQLDPRSGRRALAIGSENSNVVTIVDLDLNSHPLSMSNVVLQEDRTGAMGVNAVKISPEIGMGGDTPNATLVNDNAAPGGQMQFLYAIASDATVRVANILTPSTNVECDTQVDPRYLHDVTDVAFLSCMPVGGPKTPPRRAGAIGPGIQLPNRMPAIATSVTDPSTTDTSTTTELGGTSAFAIPRGIDIFEIQPTPGDMDLPGTPTRLNGYFGVISASNGQAYVLNVDNDDLGDHVGDGGNVIGTAIPYVIANQLRDDLPERGLLAEEDNPDGSGQVPLCNPLVPDPDASVGNEAGPRSDDTIVTTLPTIPSTYVATDKVGELPSIRQVRCVGNDETAAVSELSFPAPIAVRDAEYPDIMGMISDETWTLTWEGSVSIDTDSTASNGPAERTSMMQVDSNGMALVDQTQPFCDAGVQPYDIVTIRGCDPSLGNTDCPPGYDCFVHPDSQVAGVGSCMLSTEADRLASACKEFLISLRHYTIGKTTAGTLTLLPRKHVLRTSPVNGCTGDAQCQQLADYALQNLSPNNPIDDTTAPDTHAWSCLLDPLRAPELDDSGAPMKRCIETCAQDSDCDLGTVCSDGLCMEGIEPPQACVNAPQKYELDVGEAFAVVGALSGFHHSVIADPSGNCVQDPTASPFQIGRLPLRAPACDPTANALGILPDGTVEANPCETTVTQTETENNFMPGTCTVANPATSLVDRQADAIVFRGPAFNLTVVDPTYPGDATCIGDRGGNLGKIPLLPSLAQISERITGGFRPMFLDIQPALPGKVVRGPTDSIWVIDNGDYLSTDPNFASTAGKVYRIEAQALGTINLLE